MVVEVWHVMDWEEGGDGEASFEIPETALLADRDVL